MHSNQKTTEGMMVPVRWGVLGVAGIATSRVIPAMQMSDLCSIEAIASRDRARARNAADTFNIPRSYGNYNALLNDPAIEAVYIPLPNHLHLEWSRKALQAGKHVLCEKPMTITADETSELIALRDKTGLHVQEAFMVYHHPQWQKVLELLRDDVIGSVRAVHCSYSFTLENKESYRFLKDQGGGVIYDLASYGTTISRMVFDSRPMRVLAFAEYDPQTGIDQQVTAVLEFPGGQASIATSFMATRYQHVEIIGTKGWIRSDYPFAHANPTSCTLFIGDSTSIGAKSAKTVQFDPVNQYSLQGDHFSKQVRGRIVAQRTLEDTLENMYVIEALHRSIVSRKWESVTI